MLPAEHPHREDAAPLPRVAVIVPTYNRAASLAETLGGLLAQDYPPDRLEVLVVDNASTDSTAEVVAGAAARAPFPLRYFRKDNRGPAAARNYGLARSSSDIVGFTDSDCRPASDWVRNAVRHFAPGVGLVSGAIRPVWPTDRRLGFFQHQLAPVQREDPWYATANVFYRREVIERVGGFDERFAAFSWGPPMGGEDTELAWRVKRAGYRSAFAADASVEHTASSIPVRHWLVDPLKVQVQPRLIARIPELRSRALWGHWFVNGSSPLFYLTLVGALLAATTRRPRWLLLSVPWTWMVRGAVSDDHWPPARWWRIPVKYALLVERHGLATVAVLAASVRHRTLVL